MGKCISVRAFDDSLQLLKGCKFNRTNRYAEKTERDIARLLRWVRTTCVRRRKAGHKDVKRIRVQIFILCKNNCTECGGF